MSQFTLFFNIFCWQFRSNQLTNMKQNKKVIQRAETNENIQKHKLVCVAVHETTNRQQATARETRRSSSFVWDDRRWQTSDRNVAPSAARPPQAFSVRCRSPRRHQLRQSCLIDARGLPRNTVLLPWQMPPVHCRSLRINQDYCDDENVISTKLFVFTSFMFVYFDITVIRI